jgi:23S rRNA-/tRNA-specific pseudouridylate synthase
VQSLWLACDVDCSAREKSQPRKGAGEIFITAAAEIARETVSATTRFEHETGKTPQIREKIGYLERQNHLQYQAPNNWLGDLDSNQH